MKSNNFYIFRVNASPNIGFGHLIRCSALAEAISERNGKIIFASNYPEIIRKVVNSFYFDLLDLSNFSPFSLEELEFLIGSLKKIQHPKAFIVDSYDVTSEYLRGIKKNFPHMLLVAIDDLGEKVYSVDILINGNLYAEKLDYSEQRKLGTKLLLGPKYLLLRKEFCNYCPSKIRDGVEDFLVTFGGSDVAGLTERVVHILVNMNLDKVKIHVVLGYGFERNIKEEFKGYSNVRFHYNLNGKEIKDLAEKTDLAISAGGSSLYELAKCGVPTIAMPIADNQIMLTEEMERYGIIDIVKFDDNFTRNLPKKILLLLHSKERRMKMQKKAVALTRGRGVWQIVAIVFREYGGML